MELPNIGKNCMVSTCNKLDFLPIKCDVCNKTFCDEHYQYTTHNCTNAYKKNNQVPACPLCNIPIPVQKGQSPDLAVSVHIDSDCKFNPAKNKRKVFTNKCSLKGCKTKEVVPIVCKECRNNYCLKHRHMADHSCDGKTAALRKQNLQTSSLQQNRNLSANATFMNVQGTMSDDEALARALALSMQETSVKNIVTQEELDLALARRLQLSESETVVGGSRNNCDRCNVS
ncbi:hypothetical protein FQA39_LY18223 [Lamprigera yunnana]|nr:hypothetical protein FQA39_LY18223 [Lamprigera yunnana]